MMMNAQTAVNENYNTTLTAHAQISRAFAEGASAAQIYEAALNETNADRKLELLQMALETDCFHAEAAAAWELMAYEKGRAQGRIMPIRSGVIHGAVHLFARYGWQVRVEMNRIAQLQKPIRPRLLRSMMTIMLIGVPAMLFYLIRIWQARQAHLHLQLEHDGTLMVMMPRNSVVVDDVAQLVAIADSIPDGLSMVWAIFAGALNLLMWMAIL